MSTKGKRSATATPQPSLAAQQKAAAAQQQQQQQQQQSQPAGSSTPISIQAAGPAISPLSPTRAARLKEKAELQGLNDRLAAYIDRVRNLETENARLTFEMQSSRETVTRETSNIKNMYEAELSDARRLLDDTAREKAKLEIDIKRLWEQLEDLKGKYDKKAKDCSIAEGNARMYEQRATDLTTKYNAANVDRKKAVDELNEAQKEIDRLRKQLDEARKNLEDETLTRVDLENCIQSMREELAFKDQIHTQEVNESRSRRQVEISEIDGRLSQQYEDKLQQSLHELREQYEYQMRANREEIESLYETKIRNLEAAANRNSSSAINAIEELRTSRTRIDGLNARVNDLENLNAGLHSRIRELENQLDAERMRHSQNVASLEQELAELRNAMAKQMQDYQDLMDIKISLDLEIAAYDKLLCGEESRLNITPNTTNVAATVSSLSQSLRGTRATPSRKTPSRGPSLGGGKRKRTVVEESEETTSADFFDTSSSKCDITISEVDGEGKFIKLFNKGAKEVPLAGWKVQRNAGGQNGTFKFQRAMKIEPNSHITLWGTEAGVSHDPPHDILMKFHKWPVSDEMKTVLINPEGEECAQYERIRRNIITRTTRLGTGSASEQFYRQHYGTSGSGEGVAGEHGTERCAIM